MKQKLPVMLVVLLCTSLACFGQSNQNDDSGVSHPGISSSMTRKGHANIEAVLSYGKFYSRYYPGPFEYTFHQRQNVAASVVSFDYGLASWLNLGVRYQVAHIRHTYKMEPEDFISRFTVNNLGPEIRIRLFNHNNRSEAYIQSSILFPLDEYREKNKFMVSNMLVITGRIGYGFLWSLQAEGIVFPRYDQEKPPISVPVNLFAGYIINSRFIPFLLANYSTDFGSAPWLEDNQYYRLNYSAGIGIGFKYHIVHSLDLALSYINSVHSKYNDQFNNLSLGIDFSF